MTAILERNGRFERYCAMPIFYFHFRVGTRVELDSDGIELADLAAAKRHAVDSAPARVRGKVRRTDDPSAWRIEIADDAGQNVAMVNCDGVMVGS